MKKEELIEKYGDENVKFSSYYKFQFIFKNENVSCGIGGDSDDIYELIVSADEELTVRYLDPKWIQVDREFYDFRWEG